jgi:hypothetical protein
MIARDSYATEQVYRKHGRRYLPIKPFEGFPAPGVWLVTDERYHSGTASRRETVCVGVDLTHMGDVPDPLDIARLERHRDAAHAGAWEWMRSLQADRDAGRLSLISARELIDMVFGAISASMAEGTQE